MTTLQNPPTRRAQLRNALSPDEWRRANWMFVSISALHIIGFGIFIIFVVPGHYKGLGIGVSILAYTLGSRHAFDADHISAIDNTTRKLMNDRQGVDGARRPLSVGYWFSLGHSTIVVAIGCRIRHRRKGGLRRGLQQGLGPRAFRWRLWHHRVGDVSLPHRPLQHRHSCLAS